MASTEAGNGKYVIAAAVGGVCGGLAAVLATRELPRLLSEMKERMHDMCEERCGCAPHEVRESSSESAEPSCS